MQKIISVFKKYWWFVIIFIISIAYIGASYLLKTGKGPVAPISTPVSQTASFGSVVPGVGTEADLTKILGTPLSQTTDNNQTDLTYKSTNINRHHFAVVENGKVVLIKEIVNSTDNKNATSITSVYGDAPNIFYSKLPNASFKLYVYPTNGIAYLGHPDGTLLEIWYFQPTVIENFIKFWGQDYSTQPVIENNIY